MTIETGPAVVVGAGGFLGSHLVRRLAGAGVPVVPVTRARPFHPDPAQPPSLILHVATSVNPGLAERRPDLVGADRRALTAFLDALRVYDTPPPLVFAGSATVYDPAVPPPYDEDAPVRTETAYGAAKLRMEEEVLAHGAVLPVVVRLASMYGPGHRTDPGHGVVAHWATSLAGGRPLRLIGPEDVVRDFVHVADVVDAMVVLHAAVRAGRVVPTVLNVGSGVPTSLATLLRTLVAVSGRTPVIERVPGRGIDRASLWVRVDRAAGTIGWAPRTSLADGLARTWAALDDAAA